MKKFSLFVLALLCLVGCNEPVDEVVNVPFHVTNLSVLVDTTPGVRDGLAPMRVESLSDDITELWVLEGTTTLAHQTSVDANFGSPVIQLTGGQHSLTFIGSKKDGQSVSNGVWSANSASETYGYVYALNVVSGMDVQDVTLGRVNYQVVWSSTDVVPTAASTVEITISNHRSSLLAGLSGGSVNSEYKFVADISGKVGVTTYISVSGFCGVLATEEDVTSTFTVKDSGGNVLHQHSKTVPVLSNRKTVITGALFGSTKSSVSVSKEWLDDEEVAL